MSARTGSEWPGCRTIDGSPSLNGICTQMHLKISHYFVSLLHTSVLSTIDIVFVRENPRKNGIEGMELSRLDNKTIEYT